MSEPLTGEDAERLVAYIDAPQLPDGHAEFLKEADAAFAECKLRMLGLIADRIVAEHSETLRKLADE